MLNLGRNSLAAFRIRRSPPPRWLRSGQRRRRRRRSAGNAIILSLARRPARSRLQSYLSPIARISPIDEACKWGLTNFCALILLSPPPTPNSTATHTRREPATMRRRLSSDKTPPRSDTLRRRAAQLRRRCRCRRRHRRAPLLFCLCLTSLSGWNLLMSSGLRCVAVCLAACCVCVRASRCSHSVCCE